MTLPNPGVPLSISQIAAEFTGGSNPASLNEYYAGGAYVPAGTTGYYGAIPSSGTISIKDFYGASFPLPTFTAGTNSYIVFPSGPYYSYVGYGKSYSLFPSANANTAGTLSNSGTFIIGAVTYTLGLLFDRTTTSPTTNSMFFGVVGNKTGTWWSSITVNAQTWNRTSFNGQSTSGVYDAVSNTTYWQTPNVNGGPLFGLNNGISYTVQVA